MTTPKKPITYVAVSLNCWGVGLTIEEAEAKLRSAGHRKKTNYIVKALPAGARDVFVDIYGCIWWSGPQGRPTIVKDARTAKEKPP